MVGEGIAPEVIDKAATDYDMPMGPIELADTVGLDICLSVAGKMAQALHSEIPERLKMLVDQGHFGRKSGQGFYEYEDDVELI